MFASPADAPMQERVSLTLVPPVNFLKPPMSPIAMDVGGFSDACWSSGSTAWKDTFCENVTKNFNFPGVIHFSAAGSCDIIGMIASCAHVR